MAHLFDDERARHALHLTGPTDLAEHPANWLAVNGFEGKDGQLCLLPSGDVLVGCEAISRWTLAPAADRLKSGNYALAGEFSTEDANKLACGWAIGGVRYKNSGDDGPALAWPAAANRPWVEAVRDATLHGRTLINRPTNLLGPAQLQGAVEALGGLHSADVASVVGDDLLTENYPAIHAVGRAAAPDRAPRLIHLSWSGTKAKQRIAVVGKGVCFDTGGLDLKPAAGMRTMKKDMGGAATALALGHMIMSLDLPIHLDLWIPSVENSVSADAFRPGDVIDSRDGKTIEIGNTDAEGRLILVDAFSRALENGPALLIDFATLTGAARVAVGGEIAAFFSNDDSLASAIDAGAAEYEDASWRLPLHQPYGRYMSSDVADLNNITEGPGPQAGAITAALFLERFLGEDTAPAWAHFDIMAWNAAPRPGRPKGGEPMGFLAAFAAIEQLVS